MTRYPLWGLGLLGLSLLLDCSGTQRDLSGSDAEAGEAGEAGARSDSVDDAGAGGVSGTSDRAGTAGDSGATDQAGAGGEAGTSGADTSDAGAAGSVQAGCSDAEICDGLDNDCDGKVDLADGLPLGGTSAALGGDTSAIAWAPEENQYGVVYSARDSKDSKAKLFFETVNQAGNSVLSPIVVASNVYLDAGVALTWGRTEFGAAWLTPSGPINFRRIDIDGKQSEILNLGGVDPVLPSMARLPGGNWGVQHLEFDTVQGTLQASTISPTDVLAGPVPIGQGPGYEFAGNITATATNFISVFQSSVDLGAQAKIWDSKLSTAKDISIGGRVPAVGAGSSGFAIAVSHEAAPPTFHAYDTAGVEVCALSAFADRDFTPAVVVATPSGYLIASSGSGLRAQEVLQGCVLGNSFTVDAKGPVSGVTLASGKNGYGVSWRDADGAARVRFFGRRFCD